MKLVALLSFYNEQPADLERLVRSLPKAGIRRLVALDGAYALYPNAQPASSRAEHTALNQAAQAAGIQLHLRIPPTTWAGNEIEKRTALFALAEKVTTDQDWYLVIDGDEHLTDATPNLLAELEHTTFNVADITYHETKTNGLTTITPAPRLFRATRGLHCFRNHFTYRTPDGRLYWGNATTDRLEPRHVAHHIHMRHEPRPPTRRAEAKTYYRQRDQAGIETGRCQACDQHKATHRVYHQHRPAPGGWHAQALEVCATCAATLEQHWHDPTGPQQAEAIHA